MKRRYLEPISLALYSVLVYLALPMVSGRLLLRSRANGKYRKRWRERFGFGPGSSDPVVWIHAVSVGEVNAAAPLVRRLLEIVPESPILLTTITPTGSDQAARLFGRSIRHRYLPYDTPAAMRRFLNQFTPRIGIVMETEIWPNLLVECERRNVPVVLCNARLSDRSLRGYHRLRSLTTQSLRRFHCILAQSESDAARFLELGAPPAAVRVAGNIKFDASEIPDRSRIEALGAQLGANARPVWTAGSTHEGEEQLLLDVHASVLHTHPDALLVIAPRHPERFNDVATLIAAHGLAFQRRSSAAPCRPGDSVLLVDTMGELTTLYGVGAVAFVGGSLVPKGGHNLLEPLQAGTPVLFGNYMDNFRDIARLTLDYNAGDQVTDAANLASQIVSYFDDPDYRQHRVTNAQRMLHDCSGAVDRTLAEVGQMLGQCSPVESG